MYEIKASIATVKEATSTTIVNPDNIYETCKDMAESAQEQFVVITLNTKNKMIDRHLISLGTLNSTVVHPREVFRVALLDSAASIAVVHNHPSGDPSPSSADVKLTKTLIEAGKVMQIEVVDHIIIGRGFIPFFSFRESGLVEFK